MVYRCSIMSFKGARLKLFNTLIFLECLHVMLCRFWWMISRPWLIDCCSSDQFLDRNIFFWNKIMHCCGVIVMMKKWLFKSSLHNPHTCTFLASALLCFDRSVLKTFCGIFDAIDFYVFCNLMSSHIWYIQVFHFEIWKKKKKNFVVSFLQEIAMYFR